MKRSSITRNIVLLSSFAAFALALGGCFGQGNTPDDLGQTSNDPGSAELVGVDRVPMPTVAHSQRDLSISGRAPLGGANFGPQPEPWAGSSDDGDPNGGPQPEPWKAYRIAPAPEGEPAPGPKP